MTNIDTVKVYTETGYYIARHGRTTGKDTCYFLFHLRPPTDVPVEEYRDWYRSTRLQCQALDDRWPLQELRLDEMHDPRNLAEWARYSKLSDEQIERAEMMLGWGGRDIWKRIHEAWRTLEAKGPSDYVLAMRDVIVEMVAPDDEEE